MTDDEITETALNPAALNPAALNPAALNPAALRWAAATAGCAGVTVLAGLRDGESPWLVQAGDRRLVIRAGDGPGDADRLAIEAAGLRMAPQAGVPAPHLLGYDDGSRAGVPVVLSTELPGSSRIPAEPSPARLRART